MRTKQIPKEQWKAYFDAFTRAHLRDAKPETATIEVASPRLGDQVYTVDARLQGLTFDPHDRLFEVLLERADHLSFDPVEIWVIEDEKTGFVSTVELVLRDGTKEILRIDKVGLARRYDEHEVR